MFATDLMRQQEELQRIEEMRQEQMRRRQELDMRYTSHNYMLNPTLILQQKSHSSCTTFIQRAMITHGIQYIY